VDSRRLVIAVAVCGALAASAPAWGSSTFTVIEGASSDVTTGGLTTWFTGMYSPTGNPRGHMMGTEPAGAPFTFAMVFGSGERIVARAPGPGSTWTVAGGTGRYLGATGSVRTRMVGRSYAHTVRLALPRTGTPRTRMDVRVRLGTPVITRRGGPAGVGDGRAIDGTVLDAAGSSIGTYRVDSTLVKVFAGGTREWYLGDFSYVLPDGALRVVGPYPRATTAAPGALAASGRVVTGGTGAYAGMRGQVVVLPPNPDGTSTHSFTLIRG
jgi:hypothetical protein